MVQKNASGLKTNIILDNEIYGTLNVKTIVYKLILYGSNLKLQTCFNKLV